jgi:hypothetical protein
MSIDISSAIPVIHPIDIRINKEEDSQVVRAVEESSESGGSEPQLNRDEFTEIIRDNLTGVGDTYTTKGSLIKESGSRSQNRNITIDMRI